MKKLTLAVDFDDTIAVNDRFPDIGAPKKGVVEALRALHKKYNIIIYTCRMNRRSNYRKQSIAAINKFMHEHGIPFDHIDLGLEGKIHADFYIDDKAIVFENNWDEIAEGLLEGLP